MRADLVIRPAHDGDAAALAGIHVAARRAAPMPDPVHPDAVVHEHLARAIARAGSGDGGRGGHEVWVAQEARGRVVGYLRLDDAWLEDLYVHPAAAGAGVGSALLGLAQAARPAGFSLWVFESNAPARAFYARHGLVELERTDGSENEEQAPDVRMAWSGVDPVGYLRGLIDDVDEQLGRLLARRAALTAAVQPHKRSPGRDLARERAIAVAMAAHAPGLGVERLERIVHTVITESLAAAADGPPAEPGVGGA
ncbi:hypothetical protein GCM10023226_35210 [Nocardioides nanhaiensis]|uniref:GNAT family N-acetyltransferase n=1 Tax=Nocardioides nanhaiensis TaxID=1476871 RepID=A0ABP8WR76_9ACTN